MRGHAIAAVIWLGLVGGGYWAFGRLGSEAPAVTGCQDGSGLEVTVARDGHFYLDGALNGVPVRFLVDTGASYASVDSRLAARAGLQGGQPATFHTANGTTEGRIVRGQQISLACLEVRDVAVAVNPGLGDTALLGQNVLRRFEVVQTGRSLRLAPRRP